MRTTGHRSSALQETTDTFREKLQGRIVFVSLSAESNYEICVMEANGSNRTRLATFGSDEAICFLGWSPNGQQVAFTSHRTGNYEIYIMNADATHQRRLTYAGYTSYGAAWSPDGKRIAFTSTQHVTEEVYVINADGSNEKRLTATAYVEQGIPKAYNKNPTWSPDGQQIAFASARSGNQELYIMNSDGSEPRRVTNSEGWKDFPSWSPDGKYITFVGNGGISMIDTAGVNVRLLKTPSLIDLCPTWSPDGQYIAYESHVDVDMRARPPKIGHAEIFVVNVHNAQSLRLTTTNVNNRSPSWIL
jgi:tol-pal system beta propeller repeat protein TolB